MEATILTVIRPLNRGLVGKVKVTFLVRILVTVKNRGCFSIAGRIPLGFRPVTSRKSCGREEPQGWKALWARNECLCLKPLLDPLREHLLGTKEELLLDHLLRFSRVFLVRVRTWALKRVALSSHQGGASVCALTMEFILPAKARCIRS